MNAIRRQADSVGHTTDFTEDTGSTPVRLGSPSSIGAIRGIRGFSRPAGGRRGSALPMVMGLVVVLTLFGAGLLGSAGASRLDAIRRQQSLQCFWGAESALALVRQQLFTDPLYRATPTSVALTSGLMRAFADVGKAGNVFTVSARGSNTANRIDRRIEQQFVLQQYRYWDDFALFAGKGGVNLLQSIIINGDVYCEGSVSMSQSAAIFASLFCEGDLTMEQSAVIYDEAYIGGSIDLGGSSIIFGGSYPYSSPANPYIVVKPEVPPLDSAYYSAFLAQAAVTNSGLDFNDNVNLSGRVHFVTGGATLAQGKTLTSTPPGGILVVRDGFEVKQTSAIGPNLTVICGDKFWMGQSSRVGTNTTVYATNRIEMKQTGIIASQANFVTPGTLDFKQTVQASGFFYAGTVADISQSVMIQGMIFAKNGAAMGQTMTVTYNPSVLPFLPPGIMTNDAVVMTPQRWREL